jgi:hypothetical protein
MASGPSSFLAVARAASPHAHIYISSAIAQKRSAPVEHAHVVLPDVNAIGSHCIRHIDPVVDEEGHAVALGEGMKLSCGADEVRSIGGLIPVLHDGDAWDGGISK